MKDFTFMFLIGGIVVGSLSILVALPFMFGATWSEGNRDAFAGCLLYKTVLLGDDEETRMVGKVPRTVTIHYYNSTYICDDQFKSRVERVED